MQESCLANQPIDHDEKWQNANSSCPETSQGFTAESHLNNKPTLLQVIFRAEYHQTNNFLAVQCSLKVISNVKLCKLKHKAIITQIITTYQSRPFDLSTVISLRGILLFVKGLFVPGPTSSSDGLL